jgi:hypothetical protein
MKTDTVSDLGIRGALEMAAKRKLPKPGVVGQSEFFSPIFEQSTGLHLHVVPVKRSVT